MKKKEKENQEIIDAFDYLGNAASAGDCTGLIPEGDTKEKEIEEYQDVYRFGSPLEKKK